MEFLQLRYFYESVKNSSNRITLNENGFVFFATVEEIFKN